MSESPEPAGAPVRRGPPNTVLEVLRAAEGWLQSRDVDAPRLSAELLLAHVLGVSRMELYLAHDRPLSQEERDRLRPLVARRGSGSPVAYVLGDASFRGHRLAVSEDVLVPRPETEELVDVLAQLAGWSGDRGASGERPRGADLGTGSGAIAIALAVEFGASVVATELSPAAAEVARNNVAAHELEAAVDVRVGSFWEPLAGEAPLDFAVSNPPYIDPSRDDLIEPAVRAHEPALALFSVPGDPASAYRELAAGLGECVRSGGCFVFETGVEAAQPALSVLEACPAVDVVELRTDLADQPRFLVGRVT